MTRTPLSIVREARDSRRIGGNSRPSVGPRRFSSQLNSALGERGVDASRHSIPKISQSQRRLPSLPSPFGSRWSKSTAESSSERADGHRILDARTQQPDMDASHSYAQRQFTRNQLSVAQTLEIQQRLRKSFTDPGFQHALKRLQAKFPQRKERGHTDGAAFFEAFERLTLGVYQHVLPNSGFEGSLDGLCELDRRMESAAADLRVKELQAEINTLLGLPRDARFNAKRPKDELLTYRPNGDGSLPEWLLLPAPLDVDSDGDEAHEFWIEDAGTGMLVLAER